MIEATIEYRGRKRFGKVFWLLLTLVFNGLSGLYRRFCLIVRPTPAVPALLQTWGPDLILRVSTEDFPLGNPALRLECPRARRHTADGWQLCLRPCPAGTELVHPILIEGRRAVPALCGLSIEDQTHMDPRHLRRSCRKTQLPDGLRVGFPLPWGGNSVLDPGEGVGRVWLALDPDLVRFDQRITKRGTNGIGLMSDSGRDVPTTLKPAVGPALCHPETQVYVRRPEDNPLALLPRAR